MRTEAQPFTSAQLPGNSPAAHFKPLLLSLAINALCPVLIYHAIKQYTHVSEFVALVSTGIPSLIDAILGVARRKRLDFMAGMTLFTIAVSLGLIAIGGSPRLYLVRESLFTAAFGLVMLASLMLPFLFPKPIGFYFGRYFVTGNDPARGDWFDHLWDSPPFRRMIRAQTLLWGIGSVVETLVRIFLVFTLPISKFLIVSPLVYYGYMGLMFLLGGLYSRRWKRAQGQEAQMSMMDQTVTSHTPENHAASSQTTGENALTPTGPTFGVAWGFLYGVPDGNAPVFMPPLRQLGAGCTKLYLFWSQIEPEQGQYDWQAVDTFLDQLQSPEEGLIALFSSSTWATRRQAPVLPPSPARDLTDYARFVSALVGHCKGRVRYWQNDSEPNNPIFWDGTPEEFTTQLRAFHRAVKEADPAAVVVCGGYDGLFSPPGMYPMPGQERGLAFFDHVLRAGRDDFDLFDLRLYADPYTIPARVRVIREKMAALGYDKPIICTEYHGPGLFEFPVNYQYGALAGGWSAAITDEGEAERTAARARTAAGVEGLYERMATLAPETQMFMQGCPPELEQKLERLQCHDLVMRNVLALSAGIRRTMFWDFWHAPGKRDDLMTLMFGKHRLMDRTDGHFTPRPPLAGAFRQMSAILAGVTHVRRVLVSAHPTLFLYEALRHDREAVFVVWDKRDPFSADAAQPPVTFDLPWTASAVRATDALGQNIAVRRTEGSLHLEVSLTPIFLEPVNGA